MTSNDAASDNKVRRDAVGGKRGDGNRRDRRVRRGNAEAIGIGKPDASLTGVAGLVGFGAFLRREGVDAELRRQFERLKSGRTVVYPMEAQLRLLLDANVVGEPRVFGLEALAADPVFVHLAGGVVPSLDTVYRDLCRVDVIALVDLEQMMAKQGIALLPTRARNIHVDFDTTVEPLFGHQQGAVLGPNPRYHGRPSYHPIAAFVPEAEAWVGALLRPGDRALGNEDAPTMRRWLRRIRTAVGPDCIVTSRMDAAADCTKLLGVMHDEGTRLIVKARLTADLGKQITLTTQWKSVDWDADVSFQRAEWGAHARWFRVIAVRSRDRDIGKQVHLWEDSDYTVQAYITNDWWQDADEIAHEYDGRAEIEPKIAEAKHGWGIGKVPSQAFHANHAMFLIKLLAHNLARRFVRWVAPQLGGWRIEWIRRVLIGVAGRLTRSGRQLLLRLPTKSPLLALKALLR
jgi:hypothetical protein